ncbi:MAG: cbb3-type cytochrome c oxidase subunit 3 [Myxococcales bacterium]|nr:cbb3-type cytochrome c oxidase subunit 3 [Myxococcales bacterium]
MRMSEIVSKTSQTTFFVEIALVLFVAVFAGVIIYLWFLIKPEAIERAANMPLDDINPQEPIDSKHDTPATLAHKGEH